MKCKRLVGAVVLGCGVWLSGVCAQGQVQKIVENTFPVVTEEGERPYVLLPERRAIVYLTDYGKKMWIKSLDGAMAERLLYADEEHAIRKEVRISADEEQLLFYNGDALMSLDMATGRHVLLKNWPAWQVEIVDYEWAPDGVHVMFLDGQGRLYQGRSDFYSIAPLSESACGCTGVAGQYPLWTGWRERGLSVAGGEPDGVCGEPAGGADQ